MSFNNMTDVLGGIIIVALVTTLVAHKETRGQIVAVTNGATKLLRTAMGQKAGGGY